MALTQIDDRQVVNRAALSVIGTAAETTLDSVFSQLNSVVVTLAGTQTLTNKTLAFLQTNVTTDSTTTGTAATLQTGDITNGVVRLTNGSLVSISGIPAGAAAQSLTVENQTGNSVTVNNNDAGASAANRIYTGTGGSVQMATNSSLAFVYDSTISKWMVVGGTGSGSGSGSGKNYLSVYTASTAGGVPNTGNGNFELGSTTGWSLGHVTLTSNLPSGTPTFGSGSSGNLSISTVSSGQLAGSYSLSYVSSAATTAGDLLASNAFYIDTEDQAKVLGFSFSYYAAANPSNVNFSGTTSNSFGVAIYDVTNSAWIIPAGVFNLVQSSGVGVATGTFQTTSNSTQYRIVVYNANATSGAITMYFDDFFVGPKTLAFGPPVTAFGNSLTFTPNSFGTISGSSFQSWRVGNQFSVIGNFISGTPAAAAGYIALPYSIDPANFSSANGGQVVGRAWRTSGTNWPSASDGPFVVFVDGVNFDRVFITNTETSGAITKNNASSLIGAGNGLQVEFMVPIAGWSSNTVMSSDTDTRVIAMLATSTASTSIPNVTWTIVPFATTVVDTAGGYSSGTNLYTVPVAGKYEISANVIWGAPSANSTAVTAVYKNGAYLRTIGYTTANTSSGQAGSGSFVDNFNPGDTIAIYAWQNSGSALSLTAPNLTSNQMVHTFSVERVSGPAIVQASETVGMRYHAVTATLSGSPSVLTYTTKDFDTHAAYNTSTGLYTVPVTGIYQVSGAFESTDASGNFIILASIFHNGSEYARTGSGAEVTATNNAYAEITDLVSCVAGDTLAVYGLNTGTTPTIVSSNIANYISIIKR